VISRLDARLGRLEQQRSSPAFVQTEAIDRPPQETKEQWLARMAGNPDQSLVNNLGESRDQWLARRESELREQLGTNER
jgi:hypothetical protein